MAGDKVDVLDDGSDAYFKERKMATVISSRLPTQASLYEFSDGRGVKLQPVPGFDSDCTVLVQYEDGTTGTVSAAELPRSRVSQALDFWEVGLYLGIYAWIGATTESFEDRWSRAKEAHEELIEKLKAARAEPKDGDEKDKHAGQMPKSGEYWGASEESDEGDQSVRTTIKFKRDGTIHGRGNDGVDGRYTITSGRWGLLDGSPDGTRGLTRMQVAWIEKYDEGFEVAVEGRYDPEDGKIRASFTSSRGITGDFELAPKPSIW